ncbi:DNA cytosine methyltransferase [Streptomyces sp. NPDC038707]|uniref:DNA cytosine methyltransferase n=1 Tax=Streptomyces sp. NPDC038707 TaxID=3154329 RepID=UPI0033FD1FA6
MIVHGFAGIGWTEALAHLGLHDIGLELDWAACLTRIAAGHTTIHCDVTQYPTAPFKGRTTGKIDSPPCPGFGKSGKKLGLRDLPLVHQAIDDLAHGRDTRARIGAACLDDRSILTAEPMRWHYDLRPEWIAMEQVPSVLPVWEQYAEILTRWGYSTATGVLDAADYGLGQRRPRAVLIASRVREVALPAPTHGGPGQPPLTAMTDVIGWGYTQRPAPTVTGGGTATGGAEPFGNGTRQAMRKTIGSPLWKDRELPHLRPTIAECAKLQGFRPGLKFHGRQGQQHLIVGNAVPVPLADAVIRAAAGVGERDLRAAA